MGLDIKITAQVELEENIVKDLLKKHNIFFNKIQTNVANLRNDYNLHNTICTHENVEETANNQIEFDDFVLYLEDAIVSSNEVSEKDLYKKILDKLNSMQSEFGYVDVFYRFY